MSTTQQYINVGQVANDGTGEALRDAFTAVNNNFSNIWAQGPVDSQVVISNNQISTNVTNLPLVLAGNGIGTITVDSTVIPSIDAVYDLGSSTQRFDEVHARYYYGNGRFLTGISGGSGNAGNVTFSESAPADPNIGDIWIESDTGVQYIYFNDNTSSQWAEMEAYLSFSTGSANGGNGNVDFNAIQSNVTPYASGIYTLGTSSSQWLNAYVSNAVSINSVNLTTNSGKLYVNGQPVITSTANISYYNLSVTSNVIAGNNISAGNSIYANGYYYSNGISIFNTAYPGSDIILQGNTITTAKLNQNLTLTANGTGYIQTDSTIVPNLDGFYDIGGATNRYNTIFAEYFSGNGALLTGITGNWGWNGNTVYNINGGTINNSDLSHGATAAISIPFNGDSNTLSLLNYYGAIGITAAASPGNTRTWTFGTDGNLTLPTNLSNINYANGVSILNGITGGGNYANSNVVAYGEAGWAGNIIPSGNAVYSLGNATNQWSDLYVSNATIYMNNVPISLTAGNVLTVNGQDVVVTNTDGNTTLGNLQVVGSGIYIVDSSSDTQINISPDPEGWAFLQLPNNDTANAVNTRLTNDAGNVEIVSGQFSTGGGSYSWIFDSNGWLTVPANKGLQGTIDEDIVIKAQDHDNDGFAIRMEVVDNIDDPMSRLEQRRDLFRIRLDMAGADKQWQFDDSGRLVLPPDAGIWTDYPGNASIVARGVTDSSFVELLTQDSSDTRRSNITLTRDNATITTGSGAYNWTFGVDGNLTIPGTINLVGGTAVIESSANNISIYNEVSQTNGVVIWGDGAGNAGVELQSDGFLSFVTDNGNSSYQTVFLQNGNIQTAKGIFPVDDNTSDVGTGSNQFRDAYFGGNVNGDTFNTSDGGITHTGGAVGITADAGKDAYLYADGGNVGWIFDTTGNVTIPKNILGPNNGNPILVDAGATGDSYISIPSFTDGGEQLVIKNRYNSSQGIRIETETGNFVFSSGSLTFPDSTVQSTAYTGASSYGDSNVATFLAAFGSNTVSTTGNISAGNFIGGGSNVEIVAGAYDWTFGNTGILFVPGEGVIRSLDDTVTLQSFNTGTGFANSVYVGTSGGLGFADASVGSNWLEIFRSGADPQIATPGNLTIVTDSTSTAPTWTFDDTGNLTLPGNITGNTEGFAIGYRDIPQVTFSANATAALTDAGKHYYSTTAGNLALTLPDNVSVAFATGTTLTIVVNAAGNVLVNQGSGVSLYQAGSSTTGNRVVGAYGMATVMKVAANTWVINGTGVY